MKLINCSTKKLEEFFEPNIPPYAILSHTWGDDEVTYEDFIHRISDRTTQKGWPKIEKTCLLASESNLQYCWVDTCCIDKASSAVLTEEINSMFKWYSSARVCYVYLVDFDHLELKTLSTCRWFERGWTLQELIAASNVEFYDKNWVYFGTKLKLHQDISDITGIDDDVLTWEDSVQHRLRLKPICKKMSWAAKRKTTRTEDIAYSLLGIFGVNMPLIYGEGGRKAFQRLQEEIIKYSNDYTIFAWEGRGNWNFLAPGPSSFARGGRIQLTHHHFYEPEFQLTNQGLRLNARLRTRKPYHFYFLSLHCYDMDQQDEGSLGIQLVKAGKPGVYTCWSSGHQDRLFNLMNYHPGMLCESETLTISSGDDQGFPRDNGSIAYFKLQWSDSAGHEEKYKLDYEEPFSRLHAGTSSTSWLIATDDASEFAGFRKYLEAKTKRYFALVYGFSRHNEVSIGIATPVSHPDLWNAIHTRDTELACALLGKTPLAAQYYTLQCDRLKVSWSRIPHPRDGDVISITMEDSVMSI